jgi:hypothetical protein
MSNGTALYETDFRVTGHRTFQALRIFCDLANKTISDSLTQLNSSQYTSVYLTPPELLQSQSQTMINQFRSSMENSYLLSLSMIQGVTQANALLSGLQTNYKLSVISGTDNVLSVAKKYNGCSCDVSPTCIEQFAIYNYSNAATLFKVPGFYIGCNIIGSLFQSNLECFFNQTCVNELKTYLSLLAVNSSALNSSSPSVYFENSTIKDLLDNLMIEKWNTTFMYENYYEECRPRDCTYTTRTGHTVSHILNIMFLIIGVLIPVLKLVISLLVKIIGCCIRKPSGQVVPETIIAHT